MTERGMSRRGVVALGSVVALVGLAVLAVSVWGPPEKFESPRWVIGAVGGSFLFLGVWTAVLYARGYDPKNPSATMPSPRVQFAVLVPAMILFVIPFHWVAFWPGPRRFETSFSSPSLSGSGTSHGWMGRAVFGAGAILTDAMIVGLVVSLVRRMRSKS
jgi:phosphotransferase system  glucose/maltose/N-acetylglucosamine-specific IIC component